MQSIKFPVQFLFKISTLSNDFTATDTNGNVIAYVKQKMFKLKEDISIYNDDTKTKINYTIKADRWLDFSAAYSLKDRNGTEIGKITRKGWASIWKAHYQIIDQHEKEQYTIREENGWVKVFDSILGEIPFLGLLTGYLFNPSYIVTDLNDKIIARLKKQPSMLGRKFEVEQLSQFDIDDEERIVLSLMMMILLERRRG